VLLARLQREAAALVARAVRSGVAYRQERGRVEGEGWRRGVEEGRGRVLAELKNAAGTEVAHNDDSDLCGNSNSYIKHIVPSAGAYTVHAGCFDNGGCGGTVVWKVTPGSAGASGSFIFSASNTDSAQKNTVNKNVTLAAGQVIQLGTCTVSGASGSGDTYLRLYGPAGTQVAENDDSCNALSYLSYTVPAGASGTYQIRQTTGLLFHGRNAEPLDDPAWRHHQLLFRSLHPVPGQVPLHGRCLPGRRQPATAELHWRDFHRCWRGDLLLASHVHHVFSLHSTRSLPARADLGRGWAHRREQ
jgi:hypothetical protein